jgi:proline dehydrogenase
MQQTPPVNFSDTKIAYAYQTTSELKQAEWMFRFLNMPVIGPIGKAFLKFAVKVNLPVKAAIKATLYNHFVGGETLEDCLPLAARLAGNNVKSILDYSEEGKSSDEDIAHAFNELLNNVKFSATHSNVAFSVFKPTAFIATPLLEKVSRGEELDIIEKKAWEFGCTRFEELCQTAYNSNFRIMIDAEESWIQKAIDTLAYSMMEKFNKEEVHVLNTFQLYRKDRLPELKEQFEISRQKGYKLGAKLVRGAYMEKERSRAVRDAYPSPINDTKEDTDKAYDAGVKFCLEHLDRIMLFIGTHNEQSSMLGASLLQEKGLQPNNMNVWFSQLYGMSDNISFNLAAKGYNVAKYVPYGPVKSVTPYLIRRADENSSVAGQAKREIAMLQEEVIRRNLSK